MISSDHILVIISHKKKKHLSCLGDHGPNSIHKYRNFFVNLQVTSPELEQAVLDVSISLSNLIDVTGNY